MLTQDQLKTYLQYDPETGIFVWVGNTGKVNYIGKRAGTITHGYVKIRLLRRNWYAHQLAWLYMKGFIPKEIDHFDEDGLNNKWGNIREITHQNNIARSTQGFGVELHGNRYRVRLGCRSERITVGTFDTVEEARQAYLKAHQDRYGI